MNEKKYPVFLCDERKDLSFRGGMKFWCPYCKVWHLHGKGEGHRIAHCSDDSPLEPTGYILKYKDRKLAKLIKEEDKHE